MLLPGCRLRLGCRGGRHHGPLHPTPCVQGRSGKMLGSGFAMDILSGGTSSTWNQASRDCLDHTKDDNIHGLLSNPNSRIPTRGLIVIRGLH